MTKTPIAMLGIDLGTNSCSLAGMDATGAVVMRKRLTREAIVAFAATLPTCVIAMEACCGAHFLGRTLALHGHTIRLMSPEYVQPYVKAQKTDDRDAEAIVEAATRPTMRFVSLKSEAQLDLQILHRVRERLVRADHIDQPVAGGAAGARHRPAKGSYQPDASPRRAHGRRSGCQCAYTHVIG